MLKVGYLTNWILQHCPRLIVLLHRYIVHILSTGYRSVIEKCPYSKPNVSTCILKIIIIDFYSGKTI